MNAQTVSAALFIVAGILGVVTLAQTKLGNLLAWGLVAASLGGLVWVAWGVSGSV